MTVATTTRRAFTIVELLVVISVISIGAVILVPAFGRITASLNYTGAINSVVATLGSARNLAVRENRHTAVAFLWNERTQRMSLQVLIQQPGLGVTLVQGGTSSNANYAMPYRPATAIAPVELPPGTLVYGLSYTPADANLQIAGDIDDWYAGHYIEDAGTGFNPNDGDTPLWLFPRNDPSWATQQAGTAPPLRGTGVDPWEDLLSDTPRLSEQEFTDAVRGAQTFCVRFAPDGTVVTAPQVGGVRTFNAVIELTGAPLNLADRNAGAYDNDLFFDPEVAFSLVTANDEPEPNREVLMRSAAQIAVVELARLRDFAGVERPWRIEPENATTPRPRWLQGERYYRDSVAESVSNWIDLNAEVLSFNRYSGDVLRRTER